MTIDLLRKLAAGDSDIRVDGRFALSETPNGSWSMSKVWITNDAVLIYSLTEGGVRLVASSEIDGFQWVDAPRPHYVVTTVDGEEWKVTPNGGCGCGSPLKTFTPYAGPRRKGR